MAVWEKKEKLKAKKRAKEAAKERLKTSDPFAYFIGVIGPPTDIQ